MHLLHLVAGKAGETALKSGIQSTANVLGENVGKEVNDINMMSKDFTLQLSYCCNS